LTKRIIRQAKIYRGVALPPSSTTPLLRIDQNAFLINNNFTHGKLSDILMCGEE